jgi:hypothetical protein
MFCTHNEIDLKPTIITIDGADWVITQCKVCRGKLGERVRLVDLVDEGIRRSKGLIVDPPLDPDFED